MSKTEKKTFWGFLAVAFVLHLYLVVSTIVG
jgi:hypothetical protein